MSLPDSKPKDWPTIYGYADQFFYKVMPNLDTLLNKYKNILTLNQTVMSAYGSFQPFLLDYPNIFKILSEIEERDNENLKLFWKRLKEVSVYHQFAKTLPRLNKLFNESEKQLKPQIRIPKVDSVIKASAHQTISTLLETHIDARIFDSAFSRTSKLRAERIEGMQEICTMMQRRYGLGNNLLDLHNLIVYRVSFAYHAFQRIRTILQAALEHANGGVSIIIPNEEYVYNQWKEVTIWQGASSRITTACKQLFPEDPDAVHFFCHVLYLKDNQIKTEDPVRAKGQLIESFMDNRKRGMTKLRQLVQENRWCAPYWVYQEVMKL